MTTKQDFSRAHRALSVLVWGLLLSISIGTPDTAQAQTDLGDGRRAIATREELQTSLTEADQIASSDGHSAAFREIKQKEGALIRERLQEGDFQVGDQILVTVFGEVDASGLQTVAPGRVLSIKGLPDIQLRGVLRSEVEPFLGEQLRQYIRDAQVKARALIRISILGGVNRPGFYQLDADMMLSDALMSAGGIVAGADFKRSFVRRGEEKLLEKEVLTQALADGRSLDQLNLRAGDAIDVGQKPQRSTAATLQTIAIVPGLILGIYGIGKIAGVF